MRLFYSKLLSIGSANSNRTPNKVSVPLYYHLSVLFVVLTRGLNGKFPHGSKGDFERVEIIMCPVAGPTVPPAATVR